MSSAEANTRKRFPGLDAVALQHPFDRAALNALQQIPGLDVVMRKFIELFPERIAYIQNVAQTVKVTPTQCSQLHKQLQEACAILDIPAPELYVAHNPLPNAWTSGHNHPYIVVTSGLLDLMSEDEILAVLGHELGHIKCGHVLYKSMALSIGIVLTIIGDLTLGIGRLVGRGLESALLEWSRKAEFTGDRAALLVIQDPQVMLSMMMKFAGGTLFQRHEMDAKEFLKQADLYQEADASVLNRIYKGMLVAPVTHPLTIVRAREIMDWSDAREYRDILEGRYPRKRATSNASANSRNGHNGTSHAYTNATSSNSSQRAPLIRCPHCGRDQTNERFCSLCGGEIA